MAYAEVAGVPLVNAPRDRGGRGTSWVLFAAIMARHRGAILNVIWGLVAIAKSSFLVSDASYILLTDPRAWGWIALGIGALEFLSAFSIWRGGAFGRWFGIAVAVLGIIGATCLCGVDARHAGPDATRKRSGGGPGVTVVGGAPRRTPARLVLVSCSPNRSTPRWVRNARSSAVAWNASSGRHLVESSRIRESSGYSHSSATSPRVKSSCVNFSLSTKMGPRVVRSSSPRLSGVWAVVELALLLGELLPQRRITDALERQPEDFSVTVERAE
jgi:hypothetical protein